MRNVLLMLGHGESIGSDGGVDIPAVIDLVNEIRSVTDQIVLNVAVTAVLDNDQQFAFGHVLRAGTQQIDDVQVRAEVDHNFEFRHERLKANHVAVRANHFDGNNRHRFGPRRPVNASRFAFNDATERSCSQLFAQFEIGTWKLPPFIVRKQFRLFVDWQIWI